MKLQRFARAPFVWIPVLLLAAFALVSVVSRPGEPESLAYNEFIVEERGTVELKGKGCMKTYWLVGRRSAAASRV